MSIELQKRPDLFQRRKMKSWWFLFWDMDTTCSLKQPKLLFTTVWPTNRFQHLDSIKGFLQGGRPHPHCTSMLSTHTPNRKQKAAILKSFCPVRFAGLMSQHLWKMFNRVEEHLVLFIWPHMLLDTRGSLRVYNSQHAIITAPSSQSQIYIQPLPGLRRQELRALIPQPQHFRSLTTCSSSSVITLNEM